MSHFQLLKSHTLTISKFDIDDLLNLFRHPIFDMRKSYSEPNFQQCLLAEEIVLSFEATIEDLCLLHHKIAYIGEWHEPILLILQSTKWHQNQLTT